MRVELLAAQSRAEQAEADLKAKEQLVTNADRRAQQLQAQLNAKGSTDKEVGKLLELNDYFHSHLGLSVYLRMVRSFHCLLSFS